MLSFRIVTAVLLLAPGLALAETPNFELLEQELAEKFPETSARPLFAFDRRPAFVAPAPKPVEVKQVAKAAPPPPPPTPDFDEMTYLVTGIVQTGERSIAMLNHAMTGETHNVVLGTNVLPGLDPSKEVKVKVLEVQANSVTLQSENGFTVRLSVRDPFTPEVLESEDANLLAARQNN